MSAHSYIYVTIFYFLNYLFFKKKINFFFLKMMLTYHISHEKFFSTALYVHGRSGANVEMVFLQTDILESRSLDQQRGCVRLRMLQHLIVTINFAIANKV